MYSQSGNIIVKWDGWGPLLCWRMMDSVLAGVAHCIPGTGEYGGTSSRICILFCYSYGRPDCQMMVWFVVGPGQVAWGIWWAGI